MRETIRRHLHTICVIYDTGDNYLPCIHTYVPSLNRVLRVSLFLFLAIIIISRLFICSPILKNIIFFSLKRYSKIFRDYFISFYGLIRK